MSENTSMLQKLMKKKLFMGATIAASLVFFAAGIIFWGGFNTAMEATNEMGFCIGCHEMENNVYQEYKPTIHYTNRSGVRATCPDCHVPKDWTHKVIRKIQASKELWGKFTGIVDTPEKFNAHRKEMAMREWERMKETDSRECRNCHNFESMAPQFQKPRARKQHLNAFQTGQTCIDCHKGIAHKSVRDQLTDEELEKIEAPNPEFIREVPQMYIDGLALINAQEEAQKQQQLADKQGAEADMEAKIKAAVDAALMSASAVTTKSSETSDGATKPNTINIDWNKAGSRQINLLYPGQTSIEWILNGRDHGGARPFTKAGDRCMTCHDNEVADMGNKMVNGEKAEQTPIPGKRGSIPVTVSATHDNEYLYLQFSWPDSDHVPVPFVDGGKMDPDNKVKLAVMFSSDDPEFADRAGCWGTCHHDARDMPDAPDQASIDASAFKGRLGEGLGVTKYIKESRSELEIKGRGDKKRGGWDKLLSEGDLSAQLTSGIFMDLVRFKAGTKQVEDGYILGQRHMAGGEGAEFDATLQGGKWSVVMKRKLNSTNQGDLKLELGKVYNFGFAIHDDYASSRFHHVSFGYKLGFDNAEVEVNAKKQ